MTSFGLKLMAELRSARTLVAQAQAAEQTGFDFVCASDHFHPWLPEHEHSPFTWAVLGAVAQACPTLGLATGVTCPTMRYHPAIVAQAAATVATVSERRFTLAVGAGERLNEHVVGRPFPAVDQRHELLGEAIEIMQALWTGEWTTLRGALLAVEDARLYDLPREPIELVVAVSGPESLDLAASAGADGIMATDIDPDLTAGWVRRGGEPGSTWTEIPFAWAPSAEEGLRLAHERFRFAAAGWKVMSELPNPVNFAAACGTVRPEDLASTIPHGPDPEPYVQAVRKAVDAGFGRISIVPVGDDLRGLLRFWEQQVQPQLAVAA